MTFFAFNAFIWAPDQSGNRMRASVLTKSGDKQL